MDRYGLQDVSEWGVPDEYAFKFANELLEKKNEQPLFIVILSITNHPPFAVPDGYKPFPVKPTQALKERGDFGAQNEAVVMQTYQYSTNALGNFIDRVIASKEGNKTVIAATGDHKMQRMQGFLPREQFNEYTVPFYLHIPETIKENVRFRLIRNASALIKTSCPLFIISVFQIKSILPLADVTSWRRLTIQQGHSDITSNYGQTINAFIPCVTNRFALNLIRRILS